MYQFGKPVKTHAPKMWLGIVTVVLIAIAVGYLILVKNQTGTKIKNDTTPLITKIGNGNESSVTVDEPLFTMDLPGQWKETARNSDPHYQSIQWNFAGTPSAGRWIRVYVDSIPADFAVNYLLYRT